MNPTNINNEDKELEKSVKYKSFYNYYIYLIIGITVFFMVERLILYFLDPSNAVVKLLQDGRDADLRIIYNFMDLGFFNIYQDVGNLYLYFWYFLFFPIYIIPFNIAVFIWDIFRLISMIYIVKNFYKITEDKKDLIFFFIFCTIGFIADSTLNNTNWLIQLLLFESYLQFKKDKKILSGILFTIATYKITVLIFPLILLITKKIKIKDLLYYYGPFLLLCIPYAICPYYFLDFFDNLVINLDPFPFNIINSFVKIFQTPHFLYICLMFLILIVSIPNIKWRDRTRIASFILLIISLLLVLVFIIMGYNYFMTLE